MADGDIVQTAGEISLAVTSVTIDGASSKTWATPTSGNRLVLFAGGDEPVLAVTDGFTKVDDANHAAVELELWHKISDGTESSIDVTSSVSGDRGIHLVELEGSLDIDVSVTNLATSTTTIASGSSGALAAADSIALVHAFHFTANDTSFTDSYTTEIDQSTESWSYYMGLGSKVLTSTAATSTTAGTWSSADSSIILVVYSISQDATAVCTALQVNATLDTALALPLNIYMRPVSDTAAGDWDSAPTPAQDLYAQVDEVTPSDTDYIFTKDPNP